MRTTVRLDDDLLTAAKRRAVETGTTLTSVIEDALRRALRDQSGDVSEVAALPTVKGRTRAGVDLDDSAALLDLMGGS
jgi:Arc/MetJ family transcription regulator